MDPTEELKLIGAAQTLREATLIGIILALIEALNASKEPT